MLIPPNDKDRPRRVVGCMTGTSLDGIDVALIEFTGAADSLKVRSIDHAHAPLGALGDRLKAARDEAITAREWAALGRDLGVLHATTIRDQWPGLVPDLVAAHGQTLFHQPPLSVQLLNPWPIAEALGCPVLTDLRGLLLAEGQEGAPITPLADRTLYRAHITAAPLAIVNLGGFANATILATDRCEGFDCCPCNHLLDAAARARLDAAFDRDGNTARGGIPNDVRAAELAEALTRLHREGRSGGSGDEAIDLATDGFETSTAAEHLATLADAIGRAVAHTLEAARPTRISLAGGGARNAALVEAIGRHTRSSVSTTDTLGVPIEAREAAAMAVLGAVAADGQPIEARRESLLCDGLWILPRDAVRP